jgi:hypothetical protein
MNEIKPRPISHHNKSNVFIHPEMSQATHVFIRNENMKPLEQNYSGPYFIHSRKEKTLELEINNQKKIVSIDRCKPAFLPPTGQN